MCLAKKARAQELLKMQSAFTGNYFVRRTTSDCTGMFTGSFLYFAVKSGTGSLFFVFVFFGGWGVGGCFCLYTFYVHFH